MSGHKQGRPGAQIAPCFAAPVAPHSWSVGVQGRHVDGSRMHESLHGWVSRAVMAVSYSGGGVWGLRSGIYVWGRRHLAFESARIAPGS